MAIGIAVIFSCSFNKLDLRKNYSRKFPGNLMDKKKHGYVFE